MYRQLLQGMAAINHHVKVVGFTATPFRTDTGRLDRGDDRIFGGIAYQCDIVELIQRGYLSPVHAKGTRATIDTSGVHLRGGEFIESELQAAAVEGDNVPKAVAEIVARAGDRKSWLVFACGIEHAERICQEFVAVHGIHAEGIFGKTSNADRDRMVRDFREGRLRCLVNVGVLTTGFDAPGVDLIALLRPTMSPGLYVQMIGRGLRVAPGKTDCLVLDFGGNVLRHGPIDKVNVREPGEKGENAAPARECPECQELVAIQAKVCPECGYEFAVAEPERSAKHDDKPIEADLIEGLVQHTFQTWPIVYVDRQPWQKPGKTKTLRVEYHGGLNQRVSQWLCFDHEPTSYANVKARQWWVQHGGRLPHPLCVSEAIERWGELNDFVSVTVKVGGEYPELKAVVSERQPGSDDDRLPRAVADDVDYSEIPF